jgi:hypothetical protein
MILSNIFSFAMQKAENTGMSVKECSFYRFPTNAENRLQILCAPDKMKADKTDSDGKVVSERE